MKEGAFDSRNETAGIDGGFLISTVRPTSRQHVLALSIMGAVAALSLGAAPYARLPLAHTEIFLPSYAAALALVELLTSVLLLSNFRIERSGAVLLLALGYLLSGLLVIPWALTFPGVFSAIGLDANIQSTAFIAAARRIGFPLFALGYVLLEKGPLSSFGRLPPSRRLPAVAVIAVLAAAAAITALSLQDAQRLPALMLDTRMASPLWRCVPAVSISLYVAILAVLLLRRKRSVLDLWLMVVVGTLAVEFILLSYASSGIRFSLGWWVGRCFGLASASVVLIALLAETVGMYASLTRTLATERRGRESRLTALEAFSALIAHEINQPLASIATNGHAGLRWISRSEPDVAEARAAFERIVADGHRAGKIVRSIRSMAQSRAPDWIPVALNSLADEVVARGRSEAQLGRISLEVDLAETLPDVLGDPIQLRLVMENLFSNALDSLRATHDRPRFLRMSTRIRRDGVVRFELEDNGVGVESTQQERIFDPFVSTKQEGMGLGLMFCRYVIESHGGRLRMQPNEPNGAVFYFELPFPEGLPMHDPKRM